MTTASATLKLGDGVRVTGEHIVWSLNITEITPLYKNGRHSGDVYRVSPQGGRSGRNFWVSSLPGEAGGTVHARRRDAVARLEDGRTS